MSFAKKILLSLIGIGIVGSLIGMGTFASFTATTTNPGNTFSTGTLSITTSRPTQSVMTFANLIPGDVVTQALTLTNNGTIDMSLTLTRTITSTTTVLDSDATNGLQLWVGGCTSPWSGNNCTPVARALVGSGNTYAGATPVPIVNATPVSIFAGGSESFCSSNATNAAQRATRGNACAATDNYYLLFRVNLPTSAGNTFQDKSSTILFTWDGTQVTGGTFTGTQS